MRPWRTKPFSMLSTCCKSRSGLSDPKVFYLSSVCHGDWQMFSNVSKDLGVSDGTQGENLGYLSTESKNNLGVASKWTTTKWKKIHASITAFACVCVCVCLCLHLCLCLCCVAYDISAQVDVWYSEVTVICGYFLKWNRLNKKLCCLCDRTWITAHIQVLDQKRLSLT